MKKLLSMILVLSMLASMSITVFATDDAPDTTVAEQPLNDAINAAIEASGNATAEIEINSESGLATTEDAIIDVGGVVVDAKENVTIDLKGNDLTIVDPSVGSTGTETLGMQLNKDATVVIEDSTHGDNSEYENNATIILNGKSSEKDDGNPKLKMGIQNYSDLTLSGVTVDGTELSNYNSSQVLNENYVNYVVSNSSGSLTVENGASILAADGDVAFDVYFYAPSYPDAPDVTIEEDAGVIRGTIEFDAPNNEKAAAMIDQTSVEDGPSLEINGGTFENFVLEIGKAVAKFIDNISINGGTFSNEQGKDAAIVDNTGSGKKFDDFVDQTVYAVVVVDDTTWKVVPLSEVDTEEDDVVAVIPVPDPEPEYIPAPAPKPAAPAPVVVAPAAPVAVEVNGATVELTVVAEDIKAEAVAPVAAGKAAELKVNLAPAVLEVEGVETAAVIEALVAAVTVEVKDGETIAAESYEITFNENGELNIELSAEYMEALGPGEHIIVLKIGGIEIEFTIVIK